MGNKMLMQRLIYAGYKREHMYNHESDLYVFKTELTTKVINEWLKDNDMCQNEMLITTFIDNITKKIMYDIAFQYTPWWQGKDELWKNMK